MSLTRYCVNGCQTYLIIKTVLLPTLITATTTELTMEFQLYVLSLWLVFDWEVMGSCFVMVCVVYWWLKSLIWIWDHSVNYVRRDHRTDSINTNCLFFSQSAWSNNVVMFNFHLTLIDGNCLFDMWYLDLQYGWLLWTMWRSNMVTVNTLWG